MTLFLCFRHLLFKNVSTPRRPGLDSGTSVVMTYGGSTGFYYTAIPLPILTQSLFTRECLFEKRVRVSVTEIATAHYVSLFFLLIRMCVDTYYTSFKGIPYVPSSTSKCQGLLQNKIILPGPGWCFVYSGLSPEWSILSL